MTVKKFFANALVVVSSIAGLAGAAAIENLGTECGFDHPDASGYEHTCEPTHKKPVEVLKLVP